MKHSLYKRLFGDDVEISWCPGCGDFVILDVLKDVLVDLDLMPHDVVIGSGIGQAAKLPHYLNVNAFNGLHGRAVPPMLGVQIANKNLKIFISSGDGDSYGSGGNHLIHNMRRNIDVVHMVHNNMVYGLTKGQASPTTSRNQKTAMQPNGVYLEPYNPIAMAIASGATFVARAFSGNRDHLYKVLMAAAHHKGYAIVDIFQPCVSFNKVNTNKWYRDHTYVLGNEHNPYDKIQAFALSQQTEDNIPLGIIYKEDRPTFVESIPVLNNEHPLCKRFWSPDMAEAFLDDFR